MAQIRGLQPAFHAIALQIRDRGVLKQLVRGPGFHDPAYSVYHDDEGNSWLGFEPETRAGYVGISVTDELIFALYSGEHRIRGQVDTGQKIIVFTWDAHPLAVLDLDGDPVRIAVSSDGRDLYAVYRSPIPIIVRYALPEL